jgi:hypothetical protein
MSSATGDWWHGEPVPVSFGGRFLVRNQVLGGTSIEEHTCTS